MINWSKFANPSTNESAHYSDIVYPLTQRAINIVDKFNHVDCLLSSDILGNAHDRRFALSQASSHCDYDFQSSKLEQIEGAIETLDRFIDQRTGCYSRVARGCSDTGLKQDLVGMARSGTSTSEFRISPPPRASSSTMKYRRSPRPASTSTTVTTALSQPNSTLASTAPASITTTATRVSIAELLNSQPTPDVVESQLEDLSRDLNQPTAATHDPSEALLSATLDSIRSTRGITRPTSADDHRKPYHRNLISHSHHREGMDDGCYKGRAYRAARMRRSSQTRRKEMTLDGTMAPSPIMGQLVDPASLPSSPQSMPEIGAMSAKPHPTRYGPAHLQEWYNDMMARGSSSPDSDDKTTSAPRSQSITRSVKEPRSGTRADICLDMHTSEHDNSKPIKSPTSAHPVNDHVTGSSPANEVTSEAFNEAYAYGLDGPTESTARPTPYGYIAGDARPTPGSMGSGSGSGSSRYRIRGRTRERGRGLRVRVGSQFRIRELQQNAPETSVRGLEIASSVDHDKGAEAGAKDKASSSPPGHTYSNSALDSIRRRPTDLRGDTNNSHAHRAILPNTTTDSPTPATIEVDTTSPEKTARPKSSKKHCRDHDHHRNTIASSKRRKTSSKRHATSARQTSHQVVASDGEEHDADQLAEIEAAQALAEKWWKDPLGTATMAVRDPT